MKLPLHRMFEAPTVAALADLIVANEDRPGQTEKIAQILRRIKSASADDRKRYLSG